MKASGLPVSLLSALLVLANATLHVGRYDFIHKQEVLCAVISSLLGLLAPLLLRSPVLAKKIHRSVANEPRLHFGPVGRVFLRPTDVMMFGQ